MRYHRLIAGLALSVMAACSSPTAGDADQAAVEVEGQAFNAASPCNGRFVEHRLDHVTTASGPNVQLFESNGSGVAAGDLDGDDDLDLVLANLTGAGSVLWNEGDLEFRRQDLGSGRFRAVNLVDVEGDGSLDIVATSGLAAPTVWSGGEDLSSTTLPGVRQPAYAMTWGDLDGDGDLDLVTGSYDAELALEQRDAFLFGPGAGVFVYQQDGGQFQATQLAEQSDALAMALVDLDMDGWQDILVGNDFDVPDAVWLLRQGGWERADPLATTTMSTMSFDLGDLDNDGSPELFATDMKPYNGDQETIEAWQPVMDGMPDEMVEGDPQVMENVLQIRTADGFENQAPQFGVDATGWSWAGHFGDLDNDGFLDLYVVNGMVAEELFGHLPGSALVEEHQAFRNNQGEGFEPAPEWGLGTTDQGRGMTMADVDLDGDLDVVINNLGSAAQLLENRLCGGEALEVDLSWTGSRNTRALGARLALQTPDGTYHREVRAGSAYLSGDPSRLHFGLPEGAEPGQLVITWPDGATSTITDIEINQLVTVTRESGPQPDLLPSMQPLEGG